MQNNILIGFFPNIYEKLSNSSSDLTKIILDDNETNYVKSFITGIDIEVYQTTDTVPTIYTYPGLTSINDLDTKENYFQLIKSTLSSYKRLELANLKASSNNGLITVESKLKNVKLLLFYSKSCKKILTKEQRLSVYLHELGHLINYKLLIPEFIFSLLKIVPKIALGTSGVVLSFDVLKDSYQHTDLVIPAILTIITFSLIFIQGLLNRINESKADVFVKQMGYKDEYIKALTLMYHGNLDNKQSKTFLNKISEIYISLKDYLNLNEHPEHPSFDKRKKLLLKEASNISFQTLIKDIIDKLTQLIGELDDYTSKNIKLIYPWLND